MRFSSPALLILLALVGWFWRSRRSAPGGGAAIWRCATAALLVLGASGLQIRGGSEPQSVMFVLDRSDSMAAAESALLDRLRTLAQGMRPDDRAGLVVFGAQATVERGLELNFSPAEITAVTSGSATDIEAGLRTARAALPTTGSRRVVLLSDGRQTRGNAIEESERAAASGVPIDIAPLPATVGGPGLSVTRLGAPPLVRVDEPFVLTATVRGRPGENARIVLDSEGDARAEQTVALSADGVATESFSDRSRRPGMRVYRALVRSLAEEPAGDVSDQASQAGAVVMVTGRPRLLYVGGTSVGPRAVLAANGFTVEAASPATVPRTAAGLGEYDGIVLDDVRSDALEAAQASALADYVEQIGGGLLVLGGRRSFEPVLTADDPLGRILPIDLRPRSGQRSSELALVVVFDKSGSMDDRVAGAQKIDFARQSIGRALESVSATDAVGVIAFDSAAVPVAPLQAGYDPRTIGERLRDITPGGPTAIAPAVELAREWLSASSVDSAARRHILLISDGRTSPADAERLRDLVRAGGFRLSVVALGSEGDRQLLTALADAGGGRAFFPEDIRQVPTLVAREVTRVGGGRVVERHFVLQASPHPILAGIATGSLPELGGYVVSAARPTAETVLRSHLDDPILATWRIGLGRVGAYTADLGSAWSDGLRSWSEFNALLAQTVRWLSRGVEHDAMSVAVVPQNEGVRLVLEAYTPEGTPLNLVEVRAILRRPSGAVEEIQLTGSTPGRYEATVSSLDTGAHAVTIEASGRDRGFNGRVARGFYFSAEREHRFPGVDRDLLLALARTTGGATLAPGESAFAAEREPAYWSMRPWLASAAFVLFLIEVVGFGLVRPLQSRRLEGSDPDFPNREKAA